jgi:hypothetical protein
VFCAENLGAREEEVLALADAGFDYLFNSLKWWDFESPWLLDQYELYRQIAPSIAFPESHDTERLVTELLAAGFPESQIEARYRQAYALSAAFSTGVMMPMGFEYGWSRRSTSSWSEPEPIGARAGALRPEPFHRRDQPDEARRPGAQRGRAAAPAEPPGRPAAGAVAAKRERPRPGARWILVNTQEGEAREMVTEELLRRPAWTHLGDRLRSTEMLPGGGQEPAGRRRRDSGSSRSSAAAAGVRARCGGCRSSRARCRARSRPPPGMAARGAHPDRGCLAGDRRRALSDQASPATRSQSGPTFSATATTRSARWSNIAYEERGVAAGAARVLRQRPLGGAFPPGPRRALALHDRGVDRHFESWRDDVIKKRDAGQIDIAVELVEGEHLVDGRAQACRRARARRLRAIAREFARPTRRRRAELMLSARAARR